MRTDKEYLELLRAADDPDHFEWPEGYDWKAAKARFNRFADELDNAFHTACVRDNGVEDASYVADVQVPEELLHTPITTKPNVHSHAAVMVSNWGNFAIVTWSYHVKPEAMRTIEQVLEKHGYILIPEHLIWIPYTGPYVDPRWPIENWYGRYFDYG